MWVVKLGGSLLGTERLQAWLDVIACYGGGSVVVVPGGGVFADQVRATQRQWAFDDASAHHMALLAMEQYGVMMTGLRSDLVAARSAAELRAAVDRGEVPVWLARDMALERPELPASWALTADSLAVWLAARLGAGRLLLVKSFALDGGHQPCEAVRSAGVVDPLFCAYAREAGLEAWACGPNADGAFRQALHSDRGCGTRLVLGSGEVVSGAALPDAQAQRPQGR